MSLRTKLALSASLLLALSLGLFTAFILATFRQQFDGQQQSRVLQLRPLLNAALAVPVVQRDFASVQAIVEESLADPAIVRLHVYDASGRLIASAERKVPDERDADKVIWPEYRTSLELSGQNLGTVTFTLSRQDLDLAQARIARYVLTLGTLVLLLFSGLLWVSSGKVTRRLSRLAEASRSIRQGQYAVVLPQPTSDEVGDLVQAFSTMSDEIQRKVQELQALNEGLEQQVVERTRDLTQRTDELDLSVRALQTKTYLLNRAPFAVLVLDARTSAFRVLDTTNAISDVFGYAPTCFFGQPVETLELPDHRGLMARQLQTAVESDSSIEWEADVVCGGGSTRWCRCLAFPLRDAPEEGLRIALCLVDIQELRQTKDEQRRLVGELQEANKLQSVGLAIAGIAHDLNTPVGIALTASTKMLSVIDSIIAKGVQDNDTVSVPIDRLRKLHLASGLVAGNLSKAGALFAGLKTTTANATRMERRRVALLPLLDALLATLSPITHRARCAVHVTCPGNLALFTEPGSLGQVITNLVINATQHAFDGREDREIRIEVSSAERKIEIRLSDNGNGMDTDVSAKVFTPFYTTRQELGGSGLGLFSARRVVEETLGGTITMDTSLGAGTTFLIVLPLTDTSTESAMRHARQSTDVNLSMRHDDGLDENSPHAGALGA